VTSLESTTGGSGVVAQFDGGSGWLNFTRALVVEPDVTADDRGRDVRQTQIARLGACSEDMEGLVRRPVDLDGNHSTGLMHRSGVRPIRVAYVGQAFETVSGVANPNHCPA
jgi:hypothetical protein